MKSWRDNPNISAYLDGQATDDVRREVEAAAAADPDLQEFLQSWPKVQTAFAGLPRYQLSANFADSVLAAISAEDPGETSRVSANSVQPVAAAVSLAVGPDGRSSANGAPLAVQPQRASAVSPARRWHASAWLAVAAAASLMALILLPPGMLSPGDSSSTDVAQTWEDRDENASQAQLGERITEDFAGSKLLRLAEDKNAEDKDADDKDIADELKAEADQPLGQPLADADVQEQRQQFRSFSQTAQPSDMPAEVLATDVELEAYLGMLFRLQEELGELEKSRNASVGYLAMTPPPTGVDVLVCDVVVPETISDQELTQAFEQTLALQRETAVNRYKNQIDARFADAKGDQSGVRRDAQLSFSVDDERKDANLDALGKGGTIVNSPETRGGFDRAAAAAVAGLPVQTQEAYYVESTREQIDAAIENLAVKASSEVYADNLPSTSDAYQPWAVFSGFYRQKNVPAFGRQPADATAQYGAAGFGGGGGLGGEKDSSGDGESRVAGGANAADGQSHSADDVKDDAANEDDVKNTATPAQDDSSRDHIKDNTLVQRGLAIRLPSHLYEDKLQDDLGLELVKQGLPPATNTPADANSGAHRAEKSAGDMDKPVRLRPRGGAAANDNDENLRRASGGRQRGRSTEFQQTQQGDQQQGLELQQQPGQHAADEAAETVAPVRRAIVVLRIHRQVASPAEADAAKEPPPVKENKQTDGGQ